MGAPLSWLSLVNDVTLRDGLSQQIPPLCVCTGIYRCLFTLYLCYEASLKSICKGFGVLTWTSCNVNTSSCSNKILSGGAGTKTLTSDEDIKPKVY